MDKLVKNIFKLALGIFFGFLLFWVSSNKVLALTSLDPINATDIQDKYYDSKIPGFNICTYLRGEDPNHKNNTKTDPRQVGTVPLYDTSAPGPTNGSVQFGQASVFQEWFIDTCIMDGYLTAVRHVAEVHRFEVEGSLFADKIKNGDPNEANLGQLFEVAFMEVTKMPDETKRIKKEDLQLASLKDFFLVLKDSNEQFTTDLMTAISEKERIDMEALKKYELAKIEKAREDVNKLTYETMNELKGESLVYQQDILGKLTRGLGLKIVATSSASTNCPFGALVYADDGKGNTIRQCVIIKKEGRVVQNVDDFIYEESIQKARDFLMCYLAPWRHFPLGEDYYFAATSHDRITENACKEKAGGDCKILRDGTSPDFSSFAKVMGTPAWCGEEATADIMKKLKDGDFTKDKYPGYEDAFYDQYKNSTICEVAEKLGSRDIRVTKQCRVAVRKILDDKTLPAACHYQKICDAARDDANKNYTWKDADGHDLTGRPDMFDPAFKDYKKRLCPSDQIKEDMKKSFLFDLARKYKFIYTGPSEQWYYNAGNSMTGMDKQKCALILGNLGYDVEGLFIEQLDNALKSNTLRAYLEYQQQLWQADLPIAIAYRPDVTDTDISSNSFGMEKNTAYGVESYLRNILDKIVGDYQSLRTAEYAVGEGLRSEKYLIGFVDKDGKYFFIDTENIVSPALFLKEKVAAATQAQFDLAQMAFKQNPESSGTNWSCPTPYAGNNLKKNEFDNPPGPYTNLKSMCSDQSKGLKHGWYLVELTDSGTPAEEKKFECRWPQFNDITCEVFGYTTIEAIKEYKMPQELPAPWEDTGTYMTIPQEYKDWADIKINDQSGEDLGLKKAPPAFDSIEYKTKYQDLDKNYGFYKDAYGDNAEFPAVSEDYYINKWYKGITQLYEKPMSEILKGWFRTE